MQYCLKCKINIRGDKACCPLCRGVLKGEPEDAAFPVIETKLSRVSFVKIVTLIAVIVIAAMICTYYLADVTWPLAVCAICAVGWADALIALYFRNNILKLLTFETLIGMLLCFIADWRLGFRGWSVQWVIPAAFVGLFFVMFLIALISKMRFEDCIIYLMFDILLSLLQIIGIVNGMNTFPKPAFVSCVILIVAGIALFLFRFRDLKRASSKWFNV